MTAPERSQRLRDTIRLIKRDLLSGQENRQRYDLGLAGWTCAACGKEALPGDRFCTKCGTPIKPVQPEAAPARARSACVNCGSALTANDVFCSRCAPACIPNGNGLADLYESNILVRVSSPTISPDGI